MASFLASSRHARGFDLLAQFLDFLLLVGLAQFLLDGLHLLAQVVLALALRDLVLDVGLNLGAELQHFHFPRQLPVQALQAHFQIEALQQFLLFRAGKRGQVGGDEIGQAAGVVDVHDHGLQIVGERGRELHHLLEHAWSRCAPGRRSPIPSRSGRCPPSGFTRARR